MSRNIITVYYAATAIFIALDYVFGINVRAAFLESSPGWRVAYYLFLFLCLALMMWRPAWSTLIGTLESGVTLIALIINMASRSLVVTDEMIETGRGVVTMPEIINFIIAGGAAYISYTLGVRRLTSRSGDD